MPRSESHPNNRAQMEDSDSDYEKEDIRPRGLTGLQNLGNTCYLNSALQSLSNCPPLTQYFLDCEQLIRSDKSPMLSKSYLKLVTELWHKKRPSYVVPSGIVSGIKAVHPMFRGFTQQDAQEFLRCLMDQLHEELKMPVVVSDDSDDEDDDDDEEEEDGDDGIAARAERGDGNANNAADASDQQHSSPDIASRARRASCDSTSSQEEEEEDYETCDSGHSSESCSNSNRDISSGDENGNGSGGEEGGKDGVHQEEVNKRSRKLSALSAGSGTEEYYTPALDMVANTKEMKETANLLEKETETRRGKMLMEGGDSKEQSPGSGGSGGGVEPPATVGVTAAPAPGANTSSSSTPRDGGECQGSEPKPVTSSPSPVKSNRKPRKPPNVRYDSIISQTFDGKILSSVRCLNCETVSTTKETFQDLSLPIPSKDHLHMLHSGYPSMTGGGVSPPKGGACGEVNQGWLASVLSWMKSWFVGPTVTLQDCLAAFFSADELKGDNMYSCGKCKKLRNGLKYSKVLELPEILSIHLKRFRHEFYSSKISTYISFPLEGLNMEPYADKDCRNEVTTYDLVAIICHHGTAGGGHYTAYCLNHLNGQWYEFDDQYVTEVDVSQVMNCEAYVLFYRKSNKKIESVRQKIYETETDEQRASILKFYISRPWLSRFQTFAEPGPITNMDFLCKHGGVPPAKVPMLNNLIAEIPQDTWEILYNRFGGGMVCNHLFACKVCQNELQRIKQRQKSERELFIKLNEEFQADEYSGPVFAISMAWFRQWEGFARERYDTPPEAVDNSSVSVMRNGQPVLRQTSDHGHLSRDMWQFLHKIYGGGPELLFRNSTGTVMKTTSAASSSSVGGPTSVAVTTAISSTSTSPPQPPTHSSQQQQQQQQNKPTLASIVVSASASSSAVSASLSSASSSISSSLSSSSSSSSYSSTSYSISTSSSSSSSSSIASPPIQSPSSPRSPTSASSSMSSPNSVCTAVPTTHKSAAPAPAPAPGVSDKTTTTTDGHHNALSVHTSFCSQATSQQPQQKLTAPTTATKLTGEKKTNTSTEIHQQNQTSPSADDGIEKSNDKTVSSSSPPSFVSPLTNQVNAIQAQQNPPSNIPYHHHHHHHPSSLSSSSTTAVSCDGQQAMTGGEKPNNADKNKKKIKRAVDRGRVNNDVSSPSVPTTTTTAEENCLVQSQDSAISCTSSSYNENEMESKSTSFTDAGTTSSWSIDDGSSCSSSSKQDSGFSCRSENPSSIGSRDSGISSEGSPVSEDQNSVAGGVDSSDKIAASESGVSVSADEKNDACIRQDDDAVMPRGKSGPIQNGLGRKDSQSSLFERNDSATATATTTTTTTTATTTANVYGGDGGKVEKPGKPVGGGATGGGGGGGGGKGRNRRKKNKNMEVTRI